MKKTTIYTNGQILTVDENDSIAASMAVCGDKIIATGDFEQVRALCPDDAEIVDLQGKCIVPGCSFTLDRVRRIRPSRDAGAAGQGGFCGTARRGRPENPGRNACGGRQDPGGRSG